MSKFDKDYERFSKNGESRLIKYIRVLKNVGLKHIFYYRKFSESKGIRQKFWGFFKNKSEKKHGLEIGSLSIGAGIILVHPYDITINKNAVIGEDLTIFKGATIGSIRSGKRMGSPVIGDRVTICPNAMVCGGITIGNDVLIAANAFVDFDVPSDSVVFGNPGVIKNKENASADYL